MPRALPERADINVTATGPQPVAAGELDFAVDGRPIDFAPT